MHVGRAALSELLKSDDTLTASTSLTVREYDPDRLSLLHKDHSVVDVMPLVDDETRHFLENRERYILKDDTDEIAFALENTPYYVDPALRAKATMLGFVRRLANIGLVCFHLTRCARVGMFLWQKSSIRYVWFWTAAW